MADPNVLYLDVPLYVIIGDTVDTCTVYAHCELIIVVIIMCVIFRFIILFIFHNYIAEECSVLYSIKIKGIVGYDMFYSYCWLRHVLFIINFTISLLSL